MTAPRTTRRIRFTAPGVVECGLTSEPLAAPSPHEVVVRNRHSLVSTGTELACLGGAEPWFPLPNTPGYSAVGEVLAVGSAVAGISAGDVVLTHGPHAEVFRINTTDRYTGLCLRLPDGIPPHLAPLVRMASISLAAIRVSRIELGDNVMVAGLGLVGNLAAQLASLQGGRVIGLDVSEKRRVLAQSCGITSVVDSGRAGWKEAVRAVAGRRGISTFIDATGLSPVIADATTLVSPYGETVLLGTPRTPHQADLTAVFSGIHLPGFTTFKGALEWRFPTFPDGFTKHSIERNSEILMDLAANGRITLDRLLTRRARPEDAPDVYQGLRTAKDSHLGVIFDW